MAVFEEVDIVFVDTQGTGQLAFGHAPEMASELDIICYVCYAHSPISVLSGSRFSFNNGLIISRHFAFSLKRNRRPGADW